MWTLYIGRIVVFLCNEYEYVMETKQKIETLQHWSNSEIKKYILSQVFYLINYIKLTMTVKIIQLNTKLYSTSLLTKCKKKHLFFQV